MPSGRAVQKVDEDEEFDDPARSGHPLQRCLNVVEDLLNMEAAEPFSKPVRGVQCPIHAVWRRHTFSIHALYV